MGDTSGIRKIFVLELHVSKWDGSSPTKGPLPLGFTVPAATQANRSTALDASRLQCPRLRSVAGVMAADSCTQLGAALDGKCGWRR